MEGYEQEAARRVGTTIAGRWRIERVLGVGGMASVLFARGPDEATAAIKILHADVNAIPELRKRFLREAPIGTALHQPTPVPGIVRMLEVGEDADGTAFIAMEALAGESLYDRVAREGRLPLADALAIAEAILDVLVVAHQRGVVHRDLKPENVHLGDDGRVRVLDFGIAHVLDALPRGENGIPEKTPTRTGVIMGTAAYMAPEQATGLVREIDERTDVFSLGATLFRLLAGRTVHGPLAGTMELIAAATEPAPPLSTLASGLPADVCAVIDRALAFLKSHRYPSADVMRADVRALRSGSPPPYVTAIAGGRVAAGAPLPVAATQPDDATAGVGRAPPTLIDPGVGPTAPETTRPGPTLDDEGRSRFRVLALAIGGLALVAGVSAGIGLATCTGDGAAPQATTVPSGAASDSGAHPPAKPHPRPTTKPEK